MKAVQDKPEANSAPEIYARKLESYFSKHNGAIIAYSGGVDSALMAYVAHLALGNGMVAAIADSPSLSRREYRSALNFAQDHDIPLRIVRTREMENPHYRVNQGDRCYYCKRALFEKLEELSGQLKEPLAGSSWPVFYGVNLDDLGDYRPGMKAAREASILSPYIELGLDKGAIRALCAYYGLEIADKPAMPCMSSRILYGEEVTLEKLDQVEKAEDFLYDLGFRVLRVRHHGDTARIEVPPQDFQVLLENRKKITEKFHKLGFIYVSLDLDGFKSGSLNAILKPN
ncbi:MAG: ATP-dependent sacrificial sulfur transferase LarE [Desulfobacteraceae bacterium]|uniref:ATP-dependent sacrificial sulfur transferase LarE n=1 Tax=Candidatus Desulfacyla euxinica TaxID=2841693 RepID=A0A8J6T293_9DELT|nr:ATP-dependent sacrificial sulfur transferase LarE [Candidatus Desulfacyla euxinica]MBL6977444.1 ATP-dependent sacrificial sulfur transferase LarE [Desulfobacteraceae bacterium]MBL7218454.1 ATP-dependent sacrificial sulfur transferase LarE [Desulfobacteraceae bacterium]